jgi:hypothetical protein
MGSGWFGQSTVVVACVSLARRSLGKHRRTRALVGSGTRGGVRSRPSGFYSCGRERGHGVGMTRGCARGRSAEGVLWRARARRTHGRVHLPEFLRLQSSKACESHQMSCARSLPGT